jgi:hypothetical protein
MGSPAEAIDRVFENLDKRDFDCAIYPEVAWLYAYRHALGDSPKFKNLVLRQHGTSGISEELHVVDEEDDKIFNQLWNDSPVDSKVIGRIGAQSESARPGRTRTPSELKGRLMARRPLRRASTRRQLA